MKLSSHLNFCSYPKGKCLFSGCKILALAKAKAKILLTVKGLEFGICDFGLGPEPDFI